MIIFLWRDVIVVVVVVDVVVVVVVVIIVGSNERRDEWKFPLTRSFDAWSPYWKLSWILRKSRIKSWPA